MDVTTDFVHERSLAVRDMPRCELRPHSRQQESASDDMLRIG